MVTMPALVDQLARLDGRLSSTHANFAQHLRSAGCIAQSGKGLSASRVTAEDAATLLLAGMTTNSPTAAPRVVEVFRGLVRLPAPPAKDLPRTLGLLLQLPTFADFLAGAIDYANHLRQEMGDHGFELQVSRSVPAAGLIWRDSIGRRRSVADWLTDARRHGTNVAVPEADAGTDQRLTSSITHRTIFALGDLLERAEVWS